MESGGAEARCGEGTKFFSRDWVRGESSRLLGRPDQV